MRNVGSQAAQLEAGQLWRLKHRFVRIVTVESPGVRFKLLEAPDQAEEPTLTGDCDTLLRYVLSRHGELV